MPTETNEDVDVDKLLAELKGETSEVSDISKKEKTPDQISTKHHDYDETNMEDDTEW